MRSKRMNSALETVEDVILSLINNLERFVVIVPANFTLSHITGSRLRSETGLYFAEVDAPVTCSTREYISK